MSNNIIFSHLGVTDPEQLCRERPLVYHGNAALPDHSQERARNLFNSISIPREILKKLKEINGKCFLSQTTEGYKNVHVFSKRAKNIDGIDRICYLQYENGGLIVTEYGGTRGAHYSALFPLLSEMLCEHGFLKQKDGSFFIANAKVDEFVTLINQLNRRQLHRELQLTAVDEIDQISFNEKGVHYYYKAYWQPIPAEPVQSDLSSSSEVDVKEQVAQIERAIKALAEFSLRCVMPEKLGEIQIAVENLKNQLSILSEVCQSISDSLEKAKKLGV